MLQIKLYYKDTNENTCILNWIDEFSYKNLVAGSIPRNSKFCAHIPKVSVMIHRHTSSQNLQKEVSIVGSPEEPTHRTPTYDPIYGEVMGCGLKEYKSDR